MSKNLQRLLSVSRKRREARDVDGALKVWMPKDLLALFRAKCHDRREPIKSVFEAFARAYVNDHPACSLLIDQWAKAEGISRNPDAKSPTGAKSSMTDKQRKALYADIGVGALDVNQSDKE